MGQDNGDCDLYRWVDPGTFVCTRCVADKWLRRLIRQHSTQAICSYCKARGSKNVTAPLRVLMVPIVSALRRSFSDEVNAGCPYDSDAEDLIHNITTLDALHALDIEISERLLECVADSFENPLWVEAADDVWMGEHEHEALIWSWESFSRKVKHEQRFFFHDVDNSEKNRNVFPPSEMLHVIGQLAEKHRLVRKIKKGVGLFRVRRRDNEVWPMTEKELGAPPANKARAGRMNPAGISYMYTAFDNRTAIAETISASPAVYVISRWDTLRTLVILDLSSLPDLPSVFDEARRCEREALLFLYSFVNDISKPVGTNDNEHIEYVPTQVVSEYFAHVFHLTGNKGRLDGLQYQSAKRHEGINLVLFPSPIGQVDRFPSVGLVEYYLQNT